jgi:hypothetical protein
MNAETLLKKLKEKGIAMRIGQQAYFRAVRESKKPGGVYVDTYALLDKSRKAETEFDNTIVEVNEFEKEKAQPGLFGKEAGK